MMIICRIKEKKKLISKEIKKKNIYNEVKKIMK